MSHLLFQAPARSTVTNGGDVGKVGKKKGNVPLDDAIMSHLQAGRVSSEEAFEKAINKQQFVPYLDREPESWEL